MSAVLFIVPRFHTNLFFATKALIEAGHRVEVMAETRSGIEDYTYLQPTVLGRAPDRTRVRRLLADFRPDVVFLRHPCALSKHVGQEARRMHVRVLTYDQRPTTQRRGWSKRLTLALQRRPWERVTPVLGLDCAEPTDKATHFLPFPVEEMPVPPGTYRDPASGPVRVLCVGKLAQARKRQDALIDSLRPLSDRVTLTLAGSTNESIVGIDVAHRDRLYEAAAQNTWITVLPDVRFADMPALYASHHVCVLPSEREPLGSAPLEAMAYGTIPVISEGAGSAGYIVPGENGLRVDMSADGALEDVISRLVDDPALRVRLSDGARRTTQTELSPARFLQRIAAILA
jgi:glycosyltransferase involved in cell wall biosynthesis